MTPEIVRSVARDSFAQAGPVLRAIARGDKDVLRRMGDVDVPDGVEAIPFIRGDAKPVAEAETGEEAPQAAASEETRPRTERVSPDPPAAEPARPAPAVPDAMGPTLVEIVREGAERGEDAHTALKRAGVIGGPVWDRIVQA